ncbi:hypothetical protein [Nocardia callitridis]|uniref:DUF4878 domain-containing protein n=1 Tax=Nocardia callitridis TaxID=648753 RepID=A0ABP9KH88_9NOCA
MTRTNRSVRALVAAALPALLLCGCGGADSGDSSGPSAEALKTDATAYANALADHDYPAAYQTRSARCRLTLNQDDFAASMGQKYDGRDLHTKPAEITVTTSGETGQVTTKNFDAKASEDNPKPVKWSFIDGKWQFDNC